MHELNSTNFVFFNLVLHRSVTYKDHMKLKYLPESYVYVIFIVIVFRRFWIQGTALVHLWYCLNILT